MKVVKLNSSAKGKGIKALSKDLQEKLNGMSINDALAAGLINDIGDDAGAFIFNHSDESIDTKYAMINGCACQVSKALGEEDAEEVLESAGDLVFSKGLSLEKWKNGKQDVEGEYVEWFRLGRPRGIALGESVVTLTAEGMTVA